MAYFSPKDRTCVLYGYTVFILKKTSVEVPSVDIRFCFFKILLLFIKICTWDPDRNVRHDSNYQVNQKKKNVFAPKVDIRSFYIKLPKVPKNISPCVSH